jgi:dihydrofolate synthase/folylpolyglutamate synthase
MNTPDWPQQIKGNDIKLGLDRVLALLDRLGNPHKKLPPTIHIAGTNGKGSTLSYIDAMLQDAKYKVHKYTSPHLVKFNERIILANSPISNVYLKKIIGECEAAANKRPKIDITFFEGITAAAFLAFSRVKADILLLETGLGGRLDATNVIEKPILTIITSISRDHTEYLGDEIEKIAFEKAGIIKENCPVILSKQSADVADVIHRKASTFKNSPVLYQGKHFDFKVFKNNINFLIANNSLKLPFPSLNGRHQIENACLAIASLYMQDRLKVNTANISNGLKSAKWRGRIEKIKSGNLFSLLPNDYDLYIDGGHNIDASRALSSWISSENMKIISGGHKKPATYLICSMLKDKDSEGFFKYLSGVADFVVSVPIEKESRVQKASIIAKHAVASGIKATYSDDFEQAFKYIEAIHGSTSKSNKGILRKMMVKHPKKNPARVIICGSLYLVGEFLKEN